MRLLLLAAWRAKQHLTLMICTFIALLLLTIASQLEMFSLGVLTDKGVDFFALFASSEGGVSLETVQATWSSLQEPGTSLVTKQSAHHYLATGNQVNPLLWILAWWQKNAWFSNNFAAMMSLLLGVSIFKAIWLFISRYTTQLLAIRVSRDLRLHYFSHIQSLPMAFYQKYNIGALSSRVVSDTGQIAIAINACLTNYLQTPFTVGSSLSVCFYISWKLSLVIFVGVPLIVLPVMILARHVRRVSRQLQSNQERFTSVLLDFLGGIQTVKIFGMEAFSFRKYQEQNDRIAHFESKTAKYALLARPILHGITTLCLAAIVLFGLYVLQMSIAELLVFCGLLHLVYEPIKKFAEENAHVQKGIAAAERMFEVLQLKPYIEDREEAIDFKVFTDSIVFDHVWFRYQETFVLKDVSFTIKKGETVAIVGPTGSGKSTIVQLLSRLYDVERGEIRIDGHPLQEYKQASLRKKMAVVPQKPFLFLDTIEANIAVGRKITREIVEEASKKAHAEEFIVRLPKQYETMLADAGQNLSGGQQQRLAIARALLEKTPILVLDEATSSLDALSEHQIKLAIMALHGDVTQIIIAHRLSTIEHADKILYLDHGEKIAEGTKEELLISCPAFRAMWEMMCQTEHANQEGELV